MNLIQLLSDTWDCVGHTPLHILTCTLVFATLAGFILLYVLLLLVAPNPRGPLPSEKTYRTSTHSGDHSEVRPLPCWYDRWLAERRFQHASAADTDPAAKPRPRSDSAARVQALGVADPRAGGAAADMEPAQVAISIIMPAYNEELRIEPALEEAVEYLDQRFGRGGVAAGGKGLVRQKRLARAGDDGAAAERVSSGYEILVIDDGSTDGTMDVTLQFARRHGLHDVLRYVRLAGNRGKGGAVTHGLRHVRGEYVLFADADGASKFSDLGRLIEGCDEVMDGAGRGVAIGSRAHLVGSDAVIKRSVLRNFLMRAFHFVLTILTPPATSRIRDTQCGFKLFTRAALPHIVPFMHAEGWIFDIEMLMLAESAPPAAVVGADGRLIGAAPGIRVAEVPVGWREVPGSKLNVVDASVRMAAGLAVLRGSWMLGVYRRRVA